MSYWIAASFALLVVAFLCRLRDEAVGEDTGWTRVAEYALYLWSGTVGVCIGLGVTRLLGL